MFSVLVFSVEISACSKTFWDVFNKILIQTTILSHFFRINHTVS